MPVSIVLSNQNIRLVSARNNTIGRWATESLPAGLVRDGRILDPQALAAIMDALFTSLDLPRSEVVVSLTGLSFTYRVLFLPRMQPGLQREAIERAAQKELKVSLDELYLDWQIFSDTGKEIGVFISGVPRPLIDALVKTMKLARINLVHVDIKSLAIARAVNRADALIVDFEHEWFDIAIVSGGIPVTLHSVAPKSNNASLEDNLQQLKDELTRTIDFFNLTHKDNPVLPGTPVILIGSPTSDPALGALIPEIIGRPIQTLDCSLKAPGNFPLPLYTGNLGLIHKNGNQRVSTKAGTDRYQDIDVDPLKGLKRSLEHPVSRRKIMAAAAIFIAILLIIGVSLARHQSDAGTVQLQAEADRVNRSLRVSRLALDEAAAAETTIHNLTAETLALQKEHESISGRGSLSTILALVSDSLLQAASISGFTSTPTEVILDGGAVQRLDILDYANSLTRSGKFSGVRIALIEHKPDNLTNSPEGNYIFRIIITR
jgi:type IV pilus assembly protein PilM